MSEFEPGYTIPQLPEAGYPELERQAIARESGNSHALGEFLEWLTTERGLELCKYDENVRQSLPVTVSIEQLLAEYFGLDRDKIEEERRKMLEALGG